MDHLSHQNRRNIAFLSVNPLRLFTFLVEILECLHSGFNELNRKALPIKYVRFLTQQVDSILHNAMDIPDNKINQQVKMDFFCEIDRFYALLNLLSVGLNHEDRDTTLDHMWKEYSDEILCKKRFNKELSDHIGTLLDLAGVIGNEVSLKRPNPSLWQDQPKVKFRVFKCSQNKHLYCVPVDQAEVSCPECNNMTLRGAALRRGGNQARTPRFVQLQSMNNTESERNFQRRNISTRGATATWGRGHFTRPEDRNTSGFGSYSNPLHRPATMGGFRGRGRRPRRF